MFKFVQNCSKLFKTVQIVQNCFKFAFYKANMKSLRKNVVDEKNQ